MKKFWVLVLWGGVWSALADDPSQWQLKTGRSGHAVVTDGPLLYVIGGYNTNAFLGDIEVIDTELKNHTRLSARLIPRRYLTAVITDGKLFVMGGETPRGHEPALEIMDLESGVVTQGTPVPTPRLGSKAVCENGRIYLIGGDAYIKGSFKYTGMVEVYDIARNQWTNAAPMPVAKETCLARIGGKIYTIGGFAGGTVGLSSFECFDLALDQWQALPDLPFILSGHAVVAWRDWLITFGDYAELGRIAAYHSPSQTWRILAADWKPRRHSAAAVIGDKAYVVGGNTAERGSQSKDVQIFQLNELLAAEPKMRKE